MANIGSAMLLELGLCVLDDQGRSIFSKKFSNPVDVHALLRRQETPREIKEIEDELKRFERIMVNDNNLYSILKNAGLEVNMMPLEQQQEIKKIQLYSQLNVVCHPMKILRFSNSAILLSAYRPHV